MYISLCVFFILLYFFIIFPFLCAELLRIRVSTSHAFQSTFYPPDFKLVLSVKGIAAIVAICGICQSVNRSKQFRAMRIASERIKGAVSSITAT